MALQCNRTPVSAALRTTVLVLLFSLFSNQISGATAVPTLIFEDNFDTLNRSTWQHMITSWRGGQSQFQYYTNRTENSYVKDGILHIVPTFTADRFSESFLYNGTLNLTAEGCNFIGPENFTSSCLRKGGLNGDIINPIQSARIRTINSFSFTYGTVEIRAKLSRGDWLWPSLWMLPTDNDYGGWPRSGEIDMVEIRGNDKMECDGYISGNRRANSTLHWGPSKTADKYAKTRWSKFLTDGSFATEFHTYGLRWLPTGIVLLIDDEVVGSVYPPAGGFWKLGGSSGTNIWQNGTIMAPFDKQFHFIFKVAAGGDYFPDRCLNYNDQGEVTPKPWSTADTVQMKPFWEARNQWYPTWTRNPEDSHMLVDYIRVWSLD
ncbi:beta-1,3-glucan-binding protein-like isoform X1 [Daphnia carinata]|uniref:beta-1,3-glucan-binding protein-like isoform X1 n=1 Tax=Daphnia carinata TaxID=120202 RepID=UPI00257F5E8A|nr:beta-1,3-glucan-binding protein-like isoform X1 [Daphnia carinata]